MAGIRAEVIFEANVEQAKRSAEKAAGELNRIMGGVGKKQVGFNINSRSFTQPLGRITGSANEFTKSLEASNARVIAFGASVGIINGISDAFKNLVAETVRFEKTLADVNVVLDVSNASLQRFGQGLFDVAKNTAQSFGVAAEAALEFSRQGLTMEEVLKRTNDALTLTRLTGLKAAEAVSGLTAAVNAFSSVGLTTTQVIDKLAAVDVKFAVSSEDLINALERTGAVAIDAGVELDSLIGLVTSLQQTTARGGAVIGNGLKTIFTRIQRPKSLAQIEELDIAVRNLSGAILPADKILINIAKSFDTLTSSQKSNVVQFSAGIFQANVFRAALRDLGKTQSIQAKATEVSAGAAGEAAFKNEKLNKTIAALASQSGSAIEELAGVLGELMVKPEIGGFLDLFKGSIEGITNMLGGGEETGSTFAKGLVAGIGNVITGPAAIAFGAVFIKLFMNIAKFAQGSLKDVLDIVSRKDKIKKIEESILETLSKNKDIQESLNRLDGDREAQGKFILKVIEAQTNGMREQAALAKQLARPLLDAGVKTDLTVGGRGPVDLDGDGIADTFGAGGVLPSSAKRERREAARGGYSAGAVDSMSIKGLGKVVYNKAEEVKQFPGMQQPAIMPPKQSRAGSAYKDAFSTKHGFDPYAARGFVPNFADLYNTGGQLVGGETGYFKTPLDLIERSLPRVGDLGGTEKYTSERGLRERQKQHLDAGKSREELLGKAHRFIYRYNTNDQVLNDLLTGDYTSLRGDVKFNKFLKSSSGTSAGRLLAAGRPLATDLGYAYEVPTKGLDVGGYHPESQLRDSVGLENAEQMYPTTKFLSQLNFARDFFGGENEAQKKLLSKGFVPNFATLSGDILRLNQSKMHLYANPREAKPGGDAVRNAMKALVDSGKPVTVRAAADKLYQGGGGSHTKAIKGLIRFIADQENGPKLFERDFKLTNLPWKGNKGEDASEDAVAKLLNKDGKKYINTGKRPGAHGDKTFPVDLIGEGLDPVEVKSGEWQQPNILLKSMRLYSDDELMQFAERQYGATPEMLKGARMEKLGKSARLLQGKGLLDKNASLEDQHKAAIKYGIAGGFVPNYAKGPATNEVTKKMWEDLTDWLLQQEAAGEVIARTEVLDDPSLPQTLKNSSAFPKSPRGVSSKLSRLLGTGEGKEAAGVRKQAEKYLGTNKYGDLIRAGRAVLPAGLGQGGVPVLPPHIKKKALPPWDWGAGEAFSRQATLGKIMSQKGGESLNNLASGGTAGMAFRDTVIGEKGFNQLANMWPGGPSAGSLAGLARTLYTADIRPYHPYELKDGTINKNAPISQAQLISAGVGAAGFEKMAASMTGAGTPTSGIGGQAPLDFTGPNGEAKNIKDFLKTQGNKGKVGGAFSWAQMIGKILRSNIGNNPALTSLGGPSFQALWSSASGLGTNLFVPELASGIVPNFAGEAASGRAYEGDTISKYTNLYRGTSPKYQKAVPDRPNAPQFLFDKLLNAQTKIGFLSAAEELGTQHAKGKYSGSYNTDLKPATLEQMRGGEELGEGEVQHAGYVYKRPIKGQKKRTMPSGFVSKSKNRSVADRFSRALEFKHQGSHDQQGQIHEDKIPNNRILNKEALEKIVDRVGLPRVQKGFKRMMKNGTLKDLYMDLDQWRPKTEEGEERSSWDNTHKYRSIGHSGEGMTFDEEEVVQIWGKHSPYYGAAKGLIPNFVRWLPNPKGGPPIPAPDLDPVDGKPRSIYSGADVKEMRSKGYAYSDSKGWHYKGQAKGIGLAQTENNIKYMSGVAEPVSIRYLNSIKEFDRSKKSFLGWGQPGGDDRFSNLEELGSDMIKREVENALIIGYDSQQNMLQLIEGNHRLAAINEKNVAGEDNYNTLPAYVSGTSIRGGNYGDGVDYSKGITNRKGEPSRLPADVRAILEEQRERSSEMEGRGLKPAFGMNRIVQGRWKPSEFGIPNFADNRNRQQKISDVLGDPSNAGINFKGGTLKPRSIKSKNMFQKMWLESYFKTGLEGDYQMLMDMGYDADELLSLRSFASKGGEVNILGKGFVPNFLNSNDPSQPGITQGLKNNDRAAGRVDSLKGKFVKWIKSRVNSLSKAEKAALMGAQLIPGGSVASGSYLLVKELWRKWQDEDITSPSELNGLGLVPNFANPLKEAIAREAGAGIPKSQIKVEQSGQLRGPGNPMGLAVTNKRDEPLGVGQGIRRARSRGIDPRKHGAAAGLVPNFAAGSGDQIDIPVEILAMLNAELKKFGDIIELDVAAKMDKAAASFEKFSAVTPEAVKNLRSVDSSKDIEKGKTQAQKELSEYKKRPEDKQDKEWVKQTEEYIQALGELAAAMKEKESLPKRQAGTVERGDPGTMKTLRKLEANNLKALGAASKGTRKDLVGVNNALQDFQEELHKSEETAKEESNERGNGLQKLFYMQSAISMVNGFLEQFSEGARGATKTFLDLATAATSVTAAYIQQKEFVNQGMSMMGVGDKEQGFSLLGGNEKAKSQAAVTEAKIRGEGLQSRGGKGLGSLGKAGAMVGKLTRSFGRFLPIVGQLYTGFTVLDSGIKFLSKAFDLSAFGLEKGEGIMDYFASASTRATKRMEELSKTADSLKAALGGLESKEREQIELRELENKGTSRTIAEEKKYYDLRLKSIDTDIALSKAMGNLMDENKTGRRSLERINRVIGSTTLSMSDQRDGIRDLIIANQMLMAATSQRAGFQEGIDRAGSEDNSTRLDALAEARFMQMALALGPALEGKKGASAAEKTAALSHNIKELTKAMRFRDGDASRALNSLDFDARESVGSTGVTETLRGAIQDLNSFETDLGMPGTISESEGKSYKKGLQKFINMLQKRKDAQSKGAKDDVDIRIESLKQLKLAIFKTGQDREMAKQANKMALEQNLHNSALANIKNDILKDYEGISNQAHIELKAARDKSDLTSKFNSAEKAARLDALDKLDKISGEKLTDPGSVSAKLKTELGNKTGAEAQDALKRFREATEMAARSNDPLTVGDKVVTADERKLAQDALKTAAARGMAGGKELDLVKKLQFIHEEMQVLGTARLRVILRTLLHEGEIIDRKTKEKTDLDKLLLETARGIETRGKTFELDKKMLAQTRMQSLIAEKTVAGAEELRKLLASGVPLHETITTNLAGEAATLAVINKFQQARLYYLKISQDFSKKAFETQKEKNRTEGESQLLALRQLQYQEDGLALSRDSQIAQEAKLKMEILTASQSAREAEAQRKFFSNLENRRALVEKQISAEMSGLKHTQENNKETLYQKVVNGRINYIAELELKEQETALSFEALKNAEIATNLSHLREAGSLTDMANRLQEKSNKLIEAQNAVRQASISREDLAFNARANLNTEQAGAIGETRGAAMRSLMTNSPEDALAFASSLEATNKQLNNGSRAIDRLRVRMTELDVSAKNLGADLVELGFDGVRSGFKNLLEQIGTGAKSAGDAWKEFGLNLAKTLLDRITDHNIDRIVKDLSFAFTGVEVKSEAEKIASSNSHLMDHLSSLTKSNDSLKGEILSLARQLKQGIELRPPAEDESTKPVIPDKTATGIFSLSKSITPPALPAALPQGPPPPPRPGTPAGRAQAQQSWQSSPYNQGGAPVKPSQIRLATLNDPNALTMSQRAHAAKLKLEIEGPGRVDPEFVKQKFEDGDFEENFAAKRAAAGRRVKEFALSNPSLDLATEDDLRNRIIKLEDRLEAAIEEKERAEYKMSGRMSGLDIITSDLPTSINPFHSGSLLTGSQDTDNEVFKRYLEEKGGFEEIRTAHQQAIQMDNAPVDSPSYGEGYYTRDKRAALAGQISETGRQRLSNLTKRREEIKDSTKTADMLELRGITEKIEEAQGLIAAGKRLYGANVEENRKMTSAVERLTQEVSEAPPKIDALRESLKKIISLKASQGTAPNQGGGIIQHFADGGYVKGPGGKDKVPAMLTAGEFVVPKKEVDNIQKFNNGTDKKGAEKKSTPGERLQSGIEGGLTMWAMSETARAVAKTLEDDDDADKPPTFNMKKLDNLDLGSDVNIKRGDPRLSSKFLARDPVMQEYRDYLIESANYKAQKTNEDFKENMSTFASVFSAVTSFVTAELMSYAAPLIEKGMTAAKNWGGKTFGKHGPEYKAALSEIGPGIDYADIKSSIKTGEPIEYNGVEYSLDTSATKSVGKGRFTRQANRPGADGTYGGGAGRAWKPVSFSDNAKKLMHRESPTGGINFNGQLWSQAAKTSQFPQSSMDGSDPGMSLLIDSMGGDPMKLGSWDKGSRMDELTKKAKRRQSGGSIPAMLTAGEGYIPAPIAKRIGYNNLSHMNNTGTMPIVKGTGGVDNVGPVGLNSGDFIMKKSSTNKLLRDNPNAMRFSLQGQSDGRKGVQGYYEGGVVGSELTVPARSLGPQKSQQGNRLQLLDQKESEKSDSGAAGSTTNAETTNNININISIDKAGAEVESQEGGEDSYEKERNLSMKIKGAVLEVIREEKRIGGELS